MYALDKLILKVLSFKLVVLLAITSGQRCQTLNNLDISSMKKTEKYYLYHFKNHMKQNRPGHIVTSFYVPKYCERELCTYRTMENYPERTLPVRAVEHIALLLSYVKPSPPLGRARWDVGSKIYWNKVAWTPASLKPTVPEQLAQEKLTRQFE